MGSHEGCGGKAKERKGKKKPHWRRRHGYRSTENARRNLVRNPGGAPIAYAAPPPDTLPGRVTALEAESAALQSGLDAEEAARIAADNSIQDNLNAEVAARIAGENNLQTQINDIDVSALEERIAALEAQQQAPVTKVYADNILLGHVVAGSTFYGNPNRLFLYDINSGYFFWLKTQRAGGIMTLLLEPRDIKYESFDCTGQAYAPLYLISDTQNVLIGNGNLVYRSVGSYRGVRPVDLNSVRDAASGVCFPSNDVIFNDTPALVEAIDNPLSYELPMDVAPDGLRLEYATP